MSLAHNPRIVTDSLVLALDAANPKSYPGSGTTWSDLSGNGYTSELKGGAAYSLDNSGIFVTDGTDDYIETPRIAGTGTSTNSVTWCLWTSPLSDNGNIMSMSGSNPQGGWNMPPIAADNGKFRGKMWSNNFLYSASYTQGEWYYVCLVFNYSTTTSERYQRLYINGEAVAEQTSITYSSSGTDNYLYFGQANPGANNTGYYAGKYGCIQVYNGKALSPNQVKQNFNAHKGRYGL